MFEDLIINDGEKENIENMNIKLYEEKSWIGLGWLHGAISRELYTNSDGQMNPSKVVADSEAIDHTLAYLKPLLERGELKAGRAYFDSKLGCHPMREYTGVPEKILDEIRKEWLGADNPEKEWDADSFIGFSLPENPWKVYENH